MYDVQLPIGLNKYNKLVYVTEVSSGLDCQCVCPKCNVSLLAVNKKHNRQQPHFRHHKTTECEGAVETALHKMAKQIIADEKVFQAPEVHRIVPSAKDLEGILYTSEEVKIEAVNYHFDSVTIENQSIDKYIPDVTGFTNTIELHIEIFVTNAVKSEKKKNVRDYHDYMVEVDLSNISISTLLNKEALTQLIVHETKNKRWISHPRGQVLFEQLSAHLAKIVTGKNISINKRREESKLRNEKIEAEKLEKSKLIQQKAEEYRANISVELSELQQLNDPSWITKREDELATSARTMELPLYLKYPVSYDWLINVHRSQWQTWLFKTYIHSRNIGTFLDLSIISEDLKKTFGCVDPILDLEFHRNQLNQKHLYDPSMLNLVFTDQELKDIPSLISILRSYCNILCHCDILKKNSVRNAYTIIQSNYKIINSTINTVLNKPDRQFRNQTLSLVTLYEKEYNKRAYNLPERANAIIRSMRISLYDFNGNGRLCLNCFLISQPDDDKCPFCSKSDFNEEFEVTSSLLYEIEHYPLQYEHKVLRSCINAKQLTNISLLCLRDDSDGVI